MILNMTCQVSLLPDTEKNSNLRVNLRKLKIGEKIKAKTLNESIALINPTINVITQ